MQIRLRSFKNFLLLKYEAKREKKDLVYCYLIIKLHKVNTAFALLDTQNLADRNKEYIQDMLPHSKPEYFLSCMGTGTTKINRRTAKTVRN